MPSAPQNTNADAQLQRATNSSVCASTVFSPDVMTFRRSMPSGFDADLAAAGVEASEVLAMYDTNAQQRCKPHPVFHLLNKWVDGPTCFRATRCSTCETSETNELSSTTNSDDGGNGRVGPDLVNKQKRSTLRAHTTDDRSK